MHEDSRGARSPLILSLTPQLIKTGLTSFINSTQGISVGEGVHEQRHVPAFLNVGVFVRRTPQHPIRADVRAESGSDGRERA